MRTLTELKQYFKDNKIELDDNYEYGFNRYSKKVPYKDLWGNIRHHWEGGDLFNFDIEQSTFCCGVMEMGNFGSPDRGAEHWDAFIEYGIQKEKLKYLRTETTTNKKIDQRALEKGLKKVGFRHVTTIPSAHGKREGQRYSIKVWEWLRK